MLSSAHSILSCFASAARATLDAPRERDGRRSGHQRLVHVDHEQIPVADGPLDVHVHRRAGPFHSPRHGGTIGEQTQGAMGPTGEGSRGDTLRVNPRPPPSGSTCRPAMSSEAGQAEHRQRAPVDAADRHPARRDVGRDRHEGLQTRRVHERHRSEIQHDPSARLDRRPDRVAEQRRVAEIELPADLEHPVGAVPRPRGFPSRVHVGKTFPSLARSSNPEVFPFAALRVPSGSPDMRRDFEAFIIGGGTAGSEAAFRLADAGVGRIGIAERDRFGGECTFDGCVPTKALIRAAGIAARGPRRRPIRHTGAERRRRPAGGAAARPRGRQVPREGPRALRASGDRRVPSAGPRDRAARGRAGRLDGLARRPHRARDGHPRGHPAGPGPAGRPGLDEHRGDLGAGRGARTARDPRCRRDRRRVRPDLRQVRRVGHVCSRRARRSCRTRTPTRPRASPRRSRRTASRSAPGSRSSARRTSMACGPSPSPAAARSRRTPSWSRPARARARGARPRGSRRGARTTMAGSCSTSSLRTTSRVDLCGGGRDRRAALHAHRQLRGAAGRRCDRGGQTSP